VAEAGFGAPKVKKKKKKVVVSVAQSKEGSSFD